MQFLTLRKTRAFSLIELVIVVVIIGIIAAIAIPRMSRGAAGAGDSSLASNLATLRKALELYAAEHGNAFPTFANMPNALLRASDAAGTLKSSGTVTAADSTFPFGPYMRSIPALNVGTTAQRVNTIANGSTPDGAGGWMYDPATGNIIANLANSAVDAAGKQYNTY